MRRHGHERETDCRRDDGGACGGGLVFDLRCALLDDVMNDRGAYRIACVDDDPSILRLAVGSLAHGGYPAEIASSAEAALEHVHGWHTVDLLITDYSMPGRTGLALLEEARDHGFVGRVILFSGSLPEEARQRAAQLRVDAIIIKPGKPGELLTAVRAMLPGSDFPPGSNAPA